MRPLTESTAVRLIARIRGGDEAARSELLLRIEGLLLLVARRFVLRHPATGAAPDMDDYLQAARLAVDDAALRTWHAERGPFLKHAGFRAQAAMLDAARDWNRLGAKCSRHRRHELPLQVYIQDPREGPSHDPATEPGTAAVDDRDEAQHFARRMTQLEQRIAGLRHEGHAWQAVGAAVGYSESGAKRIYDAMLNRLRDSTRAA